MIKLDTVRPFKLVETPLKARAVLRNMFDRWLPYQKYSQPTNYHEEMISEISILDLFHNYRLEYPGSCKNIAKDWDESAFRIGDNGPLFNDLVRLGWLYFDGARWFFPRSPLGTSSHITYPSPSTKTFLTELNKIQLIAKNDNPSPSSQALAAKILDENWLERRIPVKNPDWIMGKLWEMLCPIHEYHFPDDINASIDVKMNLEKENKYNLGLSDIDIEAVDNAFLEWSTWCNALGFNIKWNDNWSPIEMKCCLAAALRTLDRQNVWGTWDNDTQRHIHMLEKTFSIPLEKFRYAWTQRYNPPNTLISRVDWLGLADVEHIMMERRSTNTVSFSFSLLCSKLMSNNIEPDIEKISDKMMSFIADHPMALQEILFKIKRNPILLVDLLINPRTSCLATRLTIDWQFESIKFNELNLSHENTTKEFAIQYALSVVFYNLCYLSIDLKELASLITWCCNVKADVSKGLEHTKEKIGLTLIKIAAKQNEIIQTTVVHHLIELVSYNKNIPQASFSSVLCALNNFTNLKKINTLPVIMIYSSFSRDFHLERTDIPRLSPELAAQLVATAFAQTPNDLEGFLIPFDSVKMIRNIQDNDRISLSHSIARTLRIHVRLLARAVVGWHEDFVPMELSNALLVLISRSIIEHAEKGRVGALTDRNGPIFNFSDEKGSPAEDLIAAWKRFDSTNQEKMLQILAQSDDPFLLAEICQNLPTIAKTNILSRLKQLIPGESSDFWTWPELQRRIQSLLNVGEYKLARKHLDEVEKDLNRAPYQFRFNIFILELQILIKEKKWKILDDVNIPIGLDESTGRQAKDQLDFYRATSQLLRPDGNLANAKVVLQRLAACNGAPSAYKENAFAVALQQLMGTSLQPLNGKDKVAGERLFEEINSAIAVNEEQASNNLLVNRALILLALQRPDDALVSVVGYRKIRRSPDLEYIFALIKNEMGCHDEAIDILDLAIEQFGSEDKFIALKNEIQSGKTIHSLASTSLQADCSQSIRAALHQLTTLNPSQVGELLGPPGQGLEGYLIRQVSNALAALQYMAAMLRNRKNPDNDLKLENDLNTAVRQLLSALFQQVEWSVSDQSLGGSTLIGNPGERDIVIKKHLHEISIYEALVCSSIDKKRIKEHFFKLFSYGSCETYFLVIYSYIEKLAPLFNYIKHIFEHEIPIGMTYLDGKNLEPNNAVNGYVATYRIDHREIKTVFLVVDLKFRNLDAYE